MTAIRYPGKLARQARWHRQHGRPEQALPYEAALARAGRCRKCGRTLTDPHSVSLGIGPDCAAEEVQR